MKWCGEAVNPGVWGLAPNDLEHPISPKSCIFFSWDVGRWVQTGSFRLGRSFDLWQLVPRSELYDVKFAFQDDDTKD